LEKASFRELAFLLVPGTTANLRRGQAKGISECRGEVGLTLEPALGRDGMDRLFRLAFQ
jgi:hypothetical protein